MARGLRSICKEDRGGAAVRKLGQFGICTKDEKLLHIYADELATILENMKEE